MLWLRRHIIQYFSSSPIPITILLSVWYIPKRSTTEIPSCCFGFDDYKLNKVDRFSVGNYNIKEKTFVLTVKKCPCLFHLKFMKHYSTTTEMVFDP
jgi:hypothetical protein